MIPLPSPIHKGGFELTMLKRLGRVAIYRQHLPGGSPDQDAYEVILPQTRTTKYTGEAVDPYEGYPAAESWGKKGWTFTSLAKAVKKLQRLHKLTQKGPCAGTVSRRKRFGGQRRPRGALLARWPTANRGLRGRNLERLRLPVDARWAFQRSATVVATEIPREVTSQSSTALPDATESKRV